MVRLDGKAEVNLLSSNGEVISLGETNTVLISVDVPKDEEIRMSSKGSFTSKNCIFDNRTIDYICGLLSPAEYKMPKKNIERVQELRRGLKRHRELF